eukprot:scaffold33511_cov130-Skeletonema_dohrnii-CCMP3373.AAC.1
MVTPKSPAGTMSSSHRRGQGVSMAVWTPAALEAVRASSPNASSPRSACNHPLSTEHAGDINNKTKST